jgi:integrase
MTPRKRKSRIYWRDQGGARRAWFDGRDYRDVGGRLEPLVVLGEHFATTDSDVANQLAAARLTELEGARRRRAFQGGRVGGGTLSAFAREHLIAKKRAGKVTDHWLAATEGFLRRAVEFFGAERELDSVRPSDVRSYVEYLATLPARKDQRKRRPRKGPPAPRAVSRMTPYTIRAHLFALSNLYRRAQESEIVPVGYNPIAVLMDKPQIVRVEARWLEVHEAALLLESARTLPIVATPAGEAIGAQLAHPLVATFVLTGGRLAEVLGLELDDVSFDRKTLTFRPNTWRRLKTQGSWRVVPLFPQLEEVLRLWVFGSRLDRGGRLLFPSFAGGEERMLVETRKLLDRIAGRVGWKRGEIRHRIFRHTYCAARLQTLDRGAPVSLYTVSRELGHGSEEMVRRVYSHLGSVRHRSEVVEYRVEQHYDRLGDQLIRLGFVTGNVTGGGLDAENEKTRASVTDGGDESSSEWARRDSNARPLAPEASALSN